MEPFFSSLNANIPEKIQKAAGENEILYWSFLNYKNLYYFILFFNIIFILLGYLIYTSPDAILEEGQISLFNNKQVGIFVCFITIVGLYFNKKQIADCYVIATKAGLIIHDPTGKEKSMQHFSWDLFKNTPNSQNYYFEKMVEIPYVDTIAQIRPDIKPGFIKYGDWNDREKLFNHINNPPKICQSLYILGVKDPEVLAEVVRNQISKMK